MLKHTGCALAALFLLGAGARAQLRLNEVFVSHVGNPDTKEYVEIRGPAGASLAGKMVLFVEGDVASAAGSLDFVIDLSAGSFGASGLYTAGSIAITPPVDQIVLGTGTNPNVNLFENGTQTVYLIQAANPSAIAALLNTDLRVGGAGTTTILATDPTITILDIVGLLDPLAGGTLFDNAPVYFDGNFLPAGVARCSDAPFAWNLLDFDFNPTAGYFDISPGTANPTCGTAAGSSFCSPGLGGVVACPCSNPPAGADRGCDNSAATGGASLAGSGNPTLAADTLVLTTADQRPTGTSIVLQGTTSIGAGLPFGQGIRCVGGALKRLYLKSAVGGSISAPAGSDPTVSARSAALGNTIAAGEHRFYMVYYRDPLVLGSCGVLDTYNATNALDVTWN